MRLSFMSENPMPRNASRRENRALVWALAIAALILLTLAAGLRADAKEFSASSTRTENFNANGNLKSLAVETVNGRVDVTAGSSFQAEVTVTVWAATESDAKKA